MDKFKFTSGAVDALNAAREEAKLCGEDVLSPMFLLLGLSSNEAGYSKSAILNAGIAPDFLRKAISKYFVVCFGSSCGETCISQEVHAITLLAQKFAFESRRSSISSMDLLYALFQRDCEEVLTVLTDMDVCYKTAKKLVEKSYVMASQRVDCEPKKSKQEKTVQMAGKNKMSTAFIMPPALGKCGRDLTALAEAGKLDPVIGRDKEIEKTVRTLLRRKKSNPCLIGKAGVGKTAIVEGLAQMIVEQQIPDALKDKRIIELNVAELLSGTKYRGNLEDRLREYQSMFTSGYLQGMNVIQTLFSELRDNVDPSHEAEMEAPFKANSTFLNAQNGRLKDILQNEIIGYKNDDGRIYLSTDMQAKLCKGGGKYNDKPSQPVDPIAELDAGIVQTAKKKEPTVVQLMQDRIDAVISGEYPETTFDLDVFGKDDVDPNAMFVNIYAGKETTMNNAELQISLEYLRENPQDAKKLIYPSSKGAFVGKTFGEIFAEKAELGRQAAISCQKLYTGGNVFAYPAPHWDGRGIMKSATKNKIIRIRPTELRWNVNSAWQNENADWACL